MGQLPRRERRSISEKNQMNIKRVIFGLLFSSSSLAYADGPIDFLNRTIKDAQIAWRSGQTSAEASAAMRAVKSKSPGALKQLELVAQRGDPDAQNMMGWLYDNGEFGVSANPSSAVQYFKAAANQGNEVAIYNIGVLTYYGRGLPLNVESSYQWFVRAAQSKLVTRACVRAAVLGIQTKKDAFLVNTNVQCATDRGNSTGFYLRGQLEYKAGHFTSAATWLTKAADAMEPNAPWIMSKLYSTTPGLTLDRVLAASWWQIGARLNPKKAGVSASGLTNFSLTDEERERANHFAQSWMSSHAQIVPINYAKTILTERD